VADPSKTLAGSHKDGAATLPIFIATVAAGGSRFGAWTSARLARGGVKAMHTRKRKPSARKSNASKGPGRRAAAPKTCSTRKSVWPTIRTGWIYCPSKPYAKVVKRQMPARTNRPT